jgi:hypothetical protein
MNTVVVLEAGVCRRAGRHREANPGGNASRVSHARAIASARGDPDRTSIAPGMVDVAEGGRGARGGAARVTDGGDAGGDQAAAPWARRAGGITG